MKKHYMMPVINVCSVEMPSLLAGSVRSVNDGYDPATQMSRGSSWIDDEDDTDDDTTPAYSPWND